MNQIIAFFSADHKAGATLICQSVFSFLKQACGSQKGILLHLSGSKGTEFTKSHQKSMDNLAQLVRSDLLDIHDILDACEKEGNWYSLEGSSFSQSRQYQPEQVKPLIDLCEKEFDYTIIDAGASLNYPLTVGALLYADKRYLVTTQQPSALKRYQEYSVYLNTLQISFRELIINRFLFSDLLKTKNEVALEYGFEPEHCHLVNYSPDGNFAEITKKTLYEEDSNRENIERIATLFAEPDPDDSKKPLFQRFKKFQI